MAHGVFIHRSDSIYHDSPAERYQFPRRYLGRAQQCVGDWIDYYGPRKVADTRGYFAVAKVERIIPDATAPAMFIALIEPGSYLDFARAVPFSGLDGVIEQGVLNDAGRISGRAQSVVRPLSVADFNRIVDYGLEETDTLLPRVDMPPLPSMFREKPMPFMYEQARNRVDYIGSRIVRDRVFRRIVLAAYDERCAITGIKLINGGGRAEVEAAHIRPVEAEGPDIVSNGLALSGTAHWMFDRGLISLGGDLEILVSRQVNDAGSVRCLINRTGLGLPPSHPSQRPHPHFLAWHREHCFKQ